jgi:hypothetical protein
MMGIANRFGAAAVAAGAPFAFVLLVSPAVGNAAECGEGTVYDADSNTCVAAQPPPAPPPPAPVWNGGDITPHFSIGICAPIPFVSLCAGI